MDSREVGIKGVHSSQSRSLGCGRRSRSWWVRSMLVTQKQVSLAKGLGSRQGSGWTKVTRERERGAWVQTQQLVEEHNVQR